MSVTPNMGLILPTVSSTPGPTYATEQNTAFETVDAHDHTSGNGVQIPSAGIGINADLPFNNENATEVKSIRFQEQSTALSGGSDIGCAYISGGNLFYNDSSGTQIQLTAGGALNAASIGGIGGDYSTSTASVYYQSIDETFYFTSNTNVPATINGGSIIVREPTASSNAITVKSATSLASSYDLTLPASLPVSTRVVSLSNSGVLATGVSSVIVSDDISSSAVTTAKINDLAVTTAKINDLAVTNAKIANGTIQPAKLAGPTYIYSSSCGAFSTSSTSYTDVTNFNWTVTLENKLTMIYIVSDASGSTPDWSTTGTGDMRYFMDGTTTLGNYNAPTTNQGAIAPPPCAFVPSAGSHSFKIQIRDVSAAGVVMNYFRVVMIQY